MIQQITCSGFMEPVLEQHLIPPELVAFYAVNVVGLARQHSKEQKRVSNATTTAGQGVGRGAEEVSTKNFKMLLEFARLLE